MYMVWFLLVALCVSGCEGTSLEKVRAAAPLQTGFFQKPYQELAVCAKHHIQEAWIFQRPIMDATHDAHRRLVSVTARDSESVLFEVTFQPAPSSMTFVEYRRREEDYDLHDQTWAIIEHCSPPAAAIAGDDVPSQPAATQELHPIAR